MPTVPFAPPSARDVAPARPSARVDRRAVVVATVCAPLLARARRAEAKSSLIDDLRQKRLNKPVFNGGRPRAQAYPDWLEGEWRATIDFAGYEFPSAVVAREAVAREATTPGFQKLLSVGIGLQRRHEERYMDCVKRLQDGAIGDINLLRVYWNGGGIWHRPKQDGMTEMEYQVNNW